MQSVGYLYTMIWMLNSLFKKSWLVAGLLLFISFSALAEGAPATLSKNLEPSSHIWQIIISLVFILLLIFTSAWLLKRFGKINGLASSQMQILANVSVGQRERIILLEVGNEQLLIGVTASKINMLHELSEPIDFSGERSGFTQSISQNFAHKLQQAMAKKEPAKKSDNDNKNKGTKGV